MILRRMITKLRQQDWLTVFLELVVVVAGIFLGLQADAWNEARKDREREVVHLQQIQADMAINVEELRGLAKQHADLEEELKFAVSAVKKESVTAEETERLKWAMMTALRYPPAMIQTGGYDSLIASGDFSILRDAELKIRLVRLHSYYDNLHDRVTAVSGGGDRPFPFPSDAIRTVPHPSGRGVMYVMDFAVVRGNPDTLGILAGERRSHSIVSEMYANGASEAEELKELITRTIEPATL